MTLHAQPCTEQARYQLVLDRGDFVVESLTEFAREEGICAASFTGLGAVKDTTVGYYDLSSREYRFMDYTADHEVVALVGNIALVDGEPFVHAHITLGDRDMRLVGGHLKEATVAVTLEISLTACAEPLERSLNEEIGLTLLNIQ